MHLFDNPTNAFLILFIPLSIAYLLLLKRTQYFYGMYTVGIPVLYYIFIEWIVALQANGTPLINNQILLAFVGGLVATILVGWSIYVRGKYQHQTTVLIKLLQLYPMCVMVIGAIWILLIIFRFDI